MTTSDRPGEVFDPGQRAQAAQIQATHPQWAVLWGCASRRFWAFPLFTAQPGTIISASDPATLLARMRHAELASTPHRAVYRLAEHAVRSGEPPVLDVIPLFESGNTLRLPGPGPRRGSTGGGQGAG